MARLALLAIVSAACLAAAPAQADVLPVDPGTSVATTVQQAPPATTTVRDTAAGVTSSVRSAVGQASEQASTKTGAKAPPADPTVGTATSLAEPAVERLDHTAAAAAAAVPSRADGSGELHAGVSSTPPEGSARLARPRDHRRTGASAAQQGPRAALAHLADVAPAPIAADADIAGAPPRAGNRVAEERSPAPDRLPSAGGGGAASAPAAGFAFGGLALLAFAVCLAGPRLHRRLLIRPAALRPVVFVSLLERPG
jgi:hypothetical protein